MTNNYPHGLPSEFSHLVGMDKCLALDLLNMAENARARISDADLGRVYLSDFERSQLQVSIKKLQDFRRYADVKAGRI